MFIFKAFDRALSHFQFHQYRKSIGNPVPMRHTIKAAWSRFWFECRALRRMSESPEIWDQDVSKVRAWLRAHNNVRAQAARYREHGWRWEFKMRCGGGLEGKWRPHRRQRTRGAIVWVPVFPRHNA